MKLAASALVFLCFVTACANTPETTSAASPEASCTETLRKVANDGEKPCECTMRKVSGEKSHDCDHE